LHARARRLVRAKDTSLRELFLSLKSLAASSIWSLCPWFGQRR
jgi:hypothetical protein